MAYWIRAWWQCNPDIKAGQHVMHMHKRIWLMVSWMSILFPLFGCGDTTNNPSVADLKKAAPTVTKAVDWQSWPCSPPGPVVGIAGLTKQQLIDKFGKGFASETFALGDKRDEFHVGLQNKYPLAKKENASIKITEMTWAGTGCKITVWLDMQNGALHAFDSLIYNKDAEF